MLKRKEKSLFIVLIIYLICFAFRIFEYFILRTDQTFWGEAFIHKLIGIAILLIVMKCYDYKPKEVGFSKDKLLLSLSKGLAFGLAIFILAYSVEALMFALRGNFETLDLYVSAYAVDGNIGNQTAFIFFVICITGNIINVVMEEGIFRGLFQKVFEKKYGFIVSAIMASVLFGMWHIIAPIRNYYDGIMSFNGFIVNSIILVSTSCLVGFKFAMMTKLTGNLYMAMGDHFVNNSIVNMIHVISKAGADELMVVRISIAQSISFIALLIWYIVAQRKKH
ncbi:MAG: CPBP family intramembrane metalloprotease [Clostridiales bacterium]|nr:CPBP family intramembrane metalloprotease [Clostridiales bacterium]